jgi:ATP-dependent DNA helicase RecG
VTPESLTKPHISQPWNPLIASVFYRSGIIERWGTGTLNILAWCNKNRNPVPVWKDDKEHSTVTLSFFPAAELKEKKGPGAHMTDPVTDPVKRLLHFLDTEKSSSQLREALNVTHRHYFRRQYIQPALEMGLIEYTIPEKPSSRLQRYRLTRKGRDAL